MTATPLSEIKGDLYQAVKKRSEEIEAATPQSSAPVVGVLTADDVMQRVAEAYGYLWHVNNPEDVPAGHPFVLPERAAYEARKLLRDMLTSTQRGDAINAVREKIESALTGRG